MVINVGFEIRKGITILTREETREEIIRLIKEKP